LNRPHDSKFRAGRAIAAMGLCVVVSGCAGELPGEARSRKRWQEVERWHVAGRVKAGEAGADASTETGRGTSGGERGELPADPTLDDYLRYALAHSPKLEAAFQEWKAALERVPQARALPDPQLRYSYFVRASMTQQAAGLSQTFPWYEKLKARGQARLEAARAAEQRFERARLALIAEVKEAYAEYAYLRQAIDVMEENRQILQSLLEAARARLEAGDVPQADIVRAEVAVEQVQDELASLKNRRSALVGRLNAALGRPSERPLPWPAGIEAVALETEEAALLTRLRERSPELAALKHEAAEQRQMLRAARQNAVPDLTVGVEYMDMVPMEDQLAVMGSINLPIWNGKREGERAEALASFNAATKRQVDRRRELASEVKTAHYRFQDARRRTALFRERLLPMAREALNSTEAAYREGEAEFEAVARAQQDLQQMQLDYQRALADRFQRLAELERLVGGGLRSSSPENLGPTEDSGAGEMEGR